MENKTRRFDTFGKQDSNEKANWLSKNIDDLLYGMLQCLATYDKENQMLYITKQTIMTNRKIICDTCGYGTTRTLLRKIDEMIDNNVLFEFDMSDDNANLDTSYPAYEIAHDNNYYYKLVDTDFISYLINTRNRHCIKIYFYLLVKYEWKEDELSQYDFTLKEIAEFLDYADSKYAIKIVKDILESFSREGIISYKDTYKDKVKHDGTVNRIHYYTLTNIIKNKSEII